MSSASPGKTRGSVLVLTLVLIAVMTALSLAGLERTNYQSQLAAALARRALLQTAATHTLADAAHNIGTGGHAQAFAPGCPQECDWRNARQADAAADVTAAYVVQRLAPASTRFLITARTVHAHGGEVLAHALFDTGADAFHFVR